MSDQHDNRLRVTLDHNCLIALEKNEPDARAIRRLVELHRTGAILLRIPAISASEWQPGLTQNTNFASFLARLEKLGLEDVELLKPHLYLGISFLDRAILAGEKTVELEEKIERILFQDIVSNDGSSCGSQDRNLSGESEAISRKRLNRRCDISSIWSHIFYEGDIFVTGDSNFHKRSKKAALVALGAGKILTPQEAIREVERSLRH